MLIQYESYSQYLFTLSASYHFGSFSSISLPVPMSHGSVNPTFSIFTMYSLATANELIFENSYERSYLNDQSSSMKLHPIRENEDSVFAAAKAYVRAQLEAYQPIMHFSAIDIIWTQTSPAANKLFIYLRTCYACMHACIAYEKRIHRQKTVRIHISYCISLVHHMNIYAEEIFKLKYIKSPQGQPTCTGFLFTFVQFYLSILVMIDLRKTC